MTEPSNALLAEKIEKLAKDFYDYRKSNDREIEKIENKVEKTNEIAVNTSLTMSYVKSAIEEMKSMMTSFVKVQNDQNKTINDFVNSDSRRNSKNTFLSTIYQATMLFVATLIGYWLNGR